MKNLNEYLKESENIDEASLLDDFEVLSQAVEDGEYEYYFERIINEFPKREAGRDAFGRKLEIGDWVLCIPPGMKSRLAMTFGVVKNVSAKKFTIIIKKDENLLTWNAWAKKRAIAEESVMNVSCFPAEVFKIEDKNAFIKSLNI